MRQWSSLLETADYIGQARHVELACFSALGRRALEVADPSVVAFLAAAARAHGWRGVQLEELLPVSLGVPGVDEATRSPGAEFDEAIEELVAEPEDTNVLDALASGLYPALLAAYRSRIASAHPAADRPLVRVLRRVRGDLEAVTAELHELCPAPSPSSPLAARFAVSLAEQLGGSLHRPSRPRSAPGQAS